MELAYFIVLTLSFIFAIIHALRLILDQQSSLVSGTTAAILILSILGCLFNVIGMAKGTDIVISYLSLIVFLILASLKMKVFTLCDGGLDVAVIALSVFISMFHFGYIIFTIVG